MTLSGTFYLIAAEGRWRSLHLRMSRKQPSLRPGEVAIRMTLELPEALFKRPALQATVTVPEDQVNRPVISATVVENIREALRQQLGVDLQISVVEPEHE